MTTRFDYFVVLAGMRTGSNFLEANLNALDGVICHGEAFNPHFIAYPSRTELLGMDRATRDAAPHRLLGAIRDQPGIFAGFRYFHDHDPRVLEAVLSDPRCAKIVLTRNPLDSYVSWKIAQATGQWKLTDVKRRKDARVPFDAAEFEAHLRAAQGFQSEIARALQRSGQTAFPVAYEDLQSLEVMNGLAAWLGVAARLEALDSSLKRQNPAPVTEKVTNPEAIAPALAALDPFDLDRVPMLEPPRGPVVPSYVAAARSGLLFLPIRSGPEAAIRGWLAALDGVEEAALSSGMNQKRLRQWKRAHPGHRSFTVLRHPVARAHAAFCDRIVNAGPGSLPQIRRALRKQFDVAVPRDGLGAGYTAQDHRAAFGAFLRFLRANLAGQTALRVDPNWTTQAAVLAGFCDFAPPDHVLREDELADMLPMLARRAGHQTSPAPVAGDDHPYPLAAIYDAEIEAEIAEIYQRDYVMFGFGPWG